ncbi:MAG TPA: DUF5667 domain-containing protein [Blastococcus sp.]|nr:DUF5667 domain-containing protein [Blastococcus sp.]
MSVHQREDAVVARLQGLAPHLDGEPDAAFRDATRARLVAMAAVRTPEPAPATGLQRLLAVRAPDVRPSRWRSRLTAGLAGAALTVTALAGLVAVAEGARPGDVLYDLKRGTEQTQLAVAGDARGQTLLDFASTRLDEIEELVGDSGTALPAASAGQDAGTVSAAGADPALVLETLRTMDEQTAEGAVWLTDRAVASRDGRPLDDLAAWAAGQSGELAALQPRMPEEATAAVGQSLALLTEIGARTDALDTALACPGGAAVAGSDRLGPVPAPCRTPEPAPPATSGGPTEPGTGSVPGATTPGSAAPGQPADPSTTVPGVPGTSGGQQSTPSVPVPVPTPTPGGGLVPSLPLPLPLPGNTGGGAASTTTSPPVVKLPPVGPITLCLPPLATVGNC